MLRLVSSRDLCLFFTRSLAKPPVKCLSLPRGIQKVNFFTKSLSRKDTSLLNQRVSEEDDSIDLNKWKTVMKSKASAEKISVKDEVDDDDDGEEETQGDLTLEATRELVSMWRLAGKLVPQEITDVELQTLAELKTKSGRKKYLKYLAIREGHKKSKKEKQQKKKAYRESLLEQRSEMDGDDQKECKNSLILQFWSRSLDKVLAWKSAQAMVFGQPLIFDMSYEGNMSNREIENTVSQLMEVEGCNRRAADPFHLHFCNLQPNSYYEQQLHKRYGEETWERLLVTSTDKQHCEVFPREQLVYLTADSPNVLRTFDHSKVYIIGALVDRSIQKGLSLANAKRLKLATARLPLDEFLHWEIGAKNLTLDQLIRILLTIKDTGKWEEALKFVPTRKHDGFHPPQRKETTSLTSKTEKVKTFKSGSNTREFTLNNYKPTINRTNTVKAKAGKSEATGKRNWWNEE